MKLKALVTAMALFSVYANAASDNTVHFQGEVSTQTCSVNINGSSAGPVVLLPTVAASKLATASSTAGETTFTVNVTDCAADAASIKTVFVGNDITSNGNLGNTGTAGNVSIQLLDSDASTPLKFVSGQSVNTSAFTKAADSTTASQELTARYFAEAASVTAGTVLASAQYAISYQ
ncbi:fimbrial protein [Pantoea vagans]|uniref:fimbrial protein n=1 Tax=Pantoea vagans TaxID=470934 RepID=UPI001093619E|nr:fimbrial protein [Pantoea vagans]QCA06823.1 type 1 fimbrial protein [Pantoea vagans]